MAQPLGEPAERGDAIHAGQPPQLEIAPPLAEPVERRNTIRVGQPRQSGIAGPRRERVEWPDTTRAGQPCQADMAAPLAQRVDGVHASATAKRGGQRPFRHWSAVLRRRGANADDRGFGQGCVSRLLQRDGRGQLVEQQQLAEQRANRSMAWRHHGRRWPRHSTGPQREPVARRDAARTRQSHVPGMAVPRREPVERSDTAYARQPRQAASAGTFLGIS